MFDDALRVLSFLILAQAAHGLEGGSAVVSGIDVSRHGGDVDWARVAEEGHAFADLKASEGVDFVDSSLHENWEDAHAAGLARGASHFYVTEDDPVEQAAFFLATVSHRTGDLAPVADVELIGHGTQPGWQLGLRSFLEVIQRELDVKALIDTSPEHRREVALLRAREPRGRPSARPPRPHL